MKYFFPTNYVLNVVVCKLWAHVASPIEFILDMAIFNKLYELPGRKCRVYSADEYRQQVVEPEGVDPALVALVTRLPIKEVGEVDLAVFVPSISKRWPMVVIECDGHEFHQLTREQASNDHRRDRRLQYWRIPVLRFTGTDIVRGSEEFAQEVVDFIAERRWTPLRQDQSGMQSGRFCSQWR
jgi:hypothetical protein